MPDGLNVNVRPARLDDVSIIVKFNQAMCRETEGHDLNEELLRRGVEGLFQRPERGFYIVATATAPSHSEHIVGQLMITFEWSDWRAAAFHWIQSVYVLPEYRRKGVFRALFEHVEREARHDPGVAGLRLYTERGNAVAKGVYERLGMREARYDMFEIDYVLAHGASD
eukprot:tig00000663_g2967.t1